MLLRFWLLCIAILSVYSCGSQSDSSTGSETPQNINSTGSKKQLTIIEEGEETFYVTSNGSKIPKAEKGITIVSETGWSQQEMKFQLSYCGQMMQSQTDIYGDVFCQCFLEKIQYYYEPIYVREAYTDQTKWNSQCIEKATR